MRLITWNDETKNSAISKAISEIENYEKLIDLLISSIDKLDLVLPSVKAFTYKGLSNAWDGISLKSKLNLSDFLSKSLFVQPKAASGRALFRTNLQS